MCIRDREACDQVRDGFDLADKYRMPVMILADGMIGQMMEAVEWHDSKVDDLPEKAWATTGTKGQRKPNIINSLFIDPNESENHNLKLNRKYEEVKANEIRYEADIPEDCEVVFVAYGTPARLARAAVRVLKEERCV